MILAKSLPRKSRPATLLGHLAEVEGPRDGAYIGCRKSFGSSPAAPSPTATTTRTLPPWGAAQLDFLRRHLRFAIGAPGERRLTILMNGMNPGLLTAAFTA